MEGTQILALAQLGATLFSSLFKEIFSATPVQVSHRGSNEGNARVTYGGPQLNIDNVIIGSSSSGNSKDHKHLETRYRVPHNVCSPFVGRDSELEQIDNAFFSNQQVDGSRRFVVFGMGGSGKTQLCLKFAETCRRNRKFWAVFFIDASSALAADNSFSSIAQKDGQRKPSKQEGMDWLANIPHDWLLIIDNADSHGLNVADYCPSSNTGYILITTRDRRCNQVANVGDITIDRLQPDDAITLLLKVAKLPHEDSKYRSKARPLVEKFGRLALALHHAGTTISESGCGLDGYLDIYDHMSHKNPDYYRNPKHNPWELSRRVIEGMGTEQSVQACEILDVAGLFHFKEIPINLFTGPSPKDRKPTTIFEYLWEQWSEMNTRKTSHEAEQCLSSLRGFRSTTSQRYDISSVRIALSLLNRYSLVSFDDNSDATPESFSMHRLVQEWSRDRLSRWDRLRSRCAAAAGLVHAIPPQERRDTDARNDRRRLLPHVNFFLFPITLSGKSAKIRLCGQLNRYQSSVAARLALVFQENGQYDKAEELYRASLNGLEKSLPEDHLDTLAVADSLGTLMERQNRYAEAEKLSRRVIEGRKRRLGETHPLTLESQRNLAVTLNSRGNHSDAEELSREILRKREETLPPESLYVTDSLHDLAISMIQQAQYREAVQLLSRVLAWRERNFGPDHQETIESLDDLAAALHNEGIIPKAEEYYQEALTRRESVLGKTHPHTLLSMSDLAFVMMKNGNMNRAKMISEEAYGTFKTHVGTAARSCAPLILRVCGQMKSKCKRYPEAEELLRKAIKGLEDDKLPPSHPDLMACRLHLALVHRKQHNYNEADMIYRQLLEGYQQNPGRVSKDEMLCLTNLAAVLEKQGEFEEAENLHRKAFYGLGLLLSQNHPQTLECLESCARCLSKRQQYDEAMRLYSRAIRGRKVKYGDADPTTLRNIAQLANTLDLQGRVGLAWAMYDAACTGFDAIGVNNKYARKCATRFTTLKTTMNEETRPIETPLLSAEESEWAQRILAPIEEQESASVAKRITATNARLKRAVPVSPTAESGGRSAKRLRLTTDPLDSK